MSEVTIGNPEELIGNLLESPGPSDTFNFRRVRDDGAIVEYPVRVRLLRVDETHAAIVAAQHYAQSKKEIAKDYGDVYREGQAIEVVWRSLCHPEIATMPDGTRRFRNLFTSADQLRASFDSVDIAQVLNMIELVKAKFGAIEDFTEDQLELWLDRLSKGFDGRRFLLQLDSSDWLQLTLGLVHEVTRLRALLTWVDTSESQPESSATTTGPSTTLPSAQSRDGISLPTDHVMDSAEARELVRQSRKPTDE